uniref:hypothetical protein n=1 Tax=Pseudomonas sp. Z003-0.4C(8344-21) TaxID=1855380 RepID=UPI0012FDFC6D|nr:hypothetical protein [Pseudomonas sp. Z003-0.4C(8344-21)]
MQKKIDGWDSKKASSEAFFNRRQFAQPALCLVSALLGFPIFRRLTIGAVVEGKLRIPGIRKPTAHFSIDEKKGLAKQDLS